MPRLSARSGQFVPIATMVMFTIMVIMVAVVNIYKVSRAKLQVQNMADAAAMNIAVQMATTVNVVTDRNEQFNHLYGNNNATSQKLDQLQDGDPCPPVDKLAEFPPISCAEFASYTKSARDGNRPFSFNSKEGLVGKSGHDGYGGLVKAINDAQKIFIDSYNAFIGAGAAGSRSLAAVLKENIPELANDPTIQVITWNSASNKSLADQTQKNLENALERGGRSNQATITPYMDPMKFQIHDMQVAYDRKKGSKILYADVKESLGKLVNDGNPVGWMEIDDQGMPKMNVRAEGQTRQRIGAGAYVMKNVGVLGIPVVVVGQATAYLVPGSGKIPATPRSAGGPAAKRPTFRPTYYAKLGKG